MSHIYFRNGSFAARAVSGGRGRQRRAPGAPAHPGVAMEKVYEIYIRSKYHFGARVTSDWTAGSHFELGHPKAGVLLGEGENLEVDPPRRLVQTMVALWGDDVKAEGATRIT